MNRYILEDDAYSLLNVSIVPGMSAELANKIFEIAMAELKKSAVEAHPVIQGKWIKENDPSDSPFKADLYRCSICGFICGEPNNYCRQCGAKMYKE